jgi:hypothetical protein
MNRTWVGAIVTIQIRWVVVAVLAAGLATVPFAPTVVAQVAFPGTVMFSDDFSDPLNGQLPRTSSQPEHYQRFYDAGEYVLQKPDPTWNFIAEAEIPGAYSDTVIDVTARLTGDTDNRYVTLVCRMQPGAGGSEYRLGVIPSVGQFRLSRFDSGKETPFVGWRGDPAILRDTTANQLELTCSGNVITAKINGTEVASSVDTTYTTGGLRIGVGSYPDANGPTEARFQSLVVLQAAPPQVDQTPPAAPTPLARQFTKHQVG